MPVFHSVCLLDLSLFVNLSAPMDSLSLLVTISICCREVLSIENKHLNPENEMKRIFGSRVVQTENRNIVSFLSIRDFLFGSGWISHNFPSSFPSSHIFTLFPFILQIRGAGNRSCPAYSVVSGAGASILALSVVVFHSYSLLPSCFQFPLEYAPVNTVYSKLTMQWLAGRESSGAERSFGALF